MTTHRAHNQTAKKDNNYVAIYIHTHSDVYIHKPNTYRVTVLFVVVEPLEDLAAVALEHAE